MVIKYAKKLPEVFWWKCIPKYYCLIHFFWANLPSKILGSLPSFSVSHQLFLLLLNGHLVFCKDRRQTLEVTWGKIISFASKNSSSFSNQFLDENTLMIHFEPFKKSELVNPMFAKVNLSLSR